MSDFEEHLRERVARAVRHYWATRSKQAKRQTSSSKVRDAGLRSAVTGGAQLDGFIELIQALLVESGLESTEVLTGRRNTVVPGFYRPSKAWDLIAVSKGQLVACIEIKSQAGPSFGNNFNNRVEEAIGNAADFWKSYEKGNFNTQIRPFLGYVMLLEEAKQSIFPTRTDEPNYPVMPEFRNASYAERYKIFGEKLLRDRLYDSVSFLLSAKHASKSGKFSEPSSELRFRTFAAHVMGRGFAISKAR